MGNRNNDELRMLEKHVIDNWDKVSPDMQQILEKLGVSPKNNNGKKTN